MKYLKRYNEAVSYLNLHGDDDHEITQVIRDNRHDYKYCDGILYELSGRNELIVSVDSVTHTEENIFYQDQVERYEEYINNGGALETFPVRELKLCDNLSEIFSYIDDEENGFDIMYDLFSKTNKSFYDLYVKDGLFTIDLDYEEYGLLTNPINIKTVEDFEENFDEELNVVVGLDIYNGISELMAHFESENEYNLLDSNHRFMALVNLGKTEVYVEIMR